MEKKSKKSMIIGMTILVLVTLSLLGLTYAYYRTRVIGNQNEKSISVTSKKLEVTYSDDSAVISATGIEPGYTISKTFSVENTGDESTSYSIKLDNVDNTFTRNDWTYKLYSGLTIENNDANLLKSGIINTNSVQSIVPSIEIVASTTGNESIDEYLLVLTYSKLEDVDQSEDMGATLSLRVNIDDELSKISESSTIQVGDYVAYEYTPNIYTTPEGDASVYSVTETFDSAGDAAIDKWRVLSTENGQIKLISDTGIDNVKLTITGQNGYINGPTVLNEMASTLYSGEYGTARSINADDISQVTGFTEFDYYYILNDEEGSIGKNVIKTIGELENELDLTGMSALASDYIIGADSLSDLKVTTYDYAVRDLGYENVHKSPINVKLIFDQTAGVEGQTAYYWVANSILGPEYLPTNSFVSYRLMFVKNTALGSRSMWSSSETVNNTKKYDTDLSYRQNIVRPIIILNLDVYVEDAQENGAWILAK